MSNLSVAFVGDVNLGSPINPNNVFDLVKRNFEAFDVKFFNLEGCLFDSERELEYKPGWHHCDAASVRALVELRFNAAACANNVHFSEDAIRSSGFDPSGLEVRHLDLKGKSNPFKVHVLPASDKN